MLCDCQYLTVGKFRARADEDIGNDKRDGGHRWTPLEVILRSDARSGDVLQAGGIHEDIAIWFLRQLYFYHRKTEFWIGYPGLAAAELDNLKSLHTKHGPEL